VGGLLLPGTGGSRELMGRAFMSAVRRRR
jgi:hypothetical protein